MKKNFLFMVILLIPLWLSAQGIYNNGGVITVGSGSYLVISGNIQNESTGNISLSGTLKIEGNLLNNGSSDLITNPLHAGSPGCEVVFSGAGLQNIGGSSSTLYTLNNVTVDNTAGIKLLKGINIDGVLNFSKGLIDIGDNNLTFGTTSSYTGNPSAVNMIIATGNGQVNKKWTAPGSFTFPVGDNTGTAEYSPVTLNFTSGNFGAGAIAGINLVNSKYNDPLMAGSYLNRYWNISQSGITGFSCDASFQYVQADVSGSEDSITSLKMGNPIIALAPVNAAVHQFNETGLTSFGTFTGGPSFRELRLKMFLEGLYSGNGKMNLSQGTSGNQFAGTVSDKVTIELHDLNSYTNLIASYPNVDLNNDGTASLKIPVSISGSYYLTIKHRNSIETTSASPVVIAPQTISYDFSSSAAQAFGSNQKRLPQAYSAIFSGDVNQDGIVDTGDMNVIDNASTIFLMGYNAADVNGDGIVDTSDMNMVDNNSASITSVQLP